MMNQLAGRCSRFYLLVGVPVLICLCFLIAPFQGSDEPAHFLRSVALSEGGVLPVVNETDRQLTGRATAGGYVNDGVRQLASRHPVIMLHDVDHKIRFSDLRMLLAIEPAPSSSYVAHSNTAIYPPIAYIPPVLGVVAARVIGLKVMLWFYAARLFGALLAAAILYQCVKRSGRLAPLVLIVAMSPIMLFQSTTISADTLLLPLAVAFAVMVARIADRVDTGRRELVLLGLVTIALTVGKIAYLPLIIIPPLALIIADGRISRRVLEATTASLIAFVAWAVWTLTIVGKVFSIRPLSEHVDVGEQLRLMSAHPFVATLILAKSIITQFPNMVIQALGSRLSWYEVRMPIVLILSGLALLVAATQIWGSERGRERRILWIAGAVSLLCYILIYCAVYLQNNPVGATVATGLLGRYFLPLFVLLLALTPRVWRISGGERWGLPVVMTWCAASAIFTVGVLTFRYWQTDVSWAARESLFMVATLA